MNKLLTLITILLFSNNVSSQSNEEGYFVGYETLEMIMNNFQNFAGEVGYRYDDKNQVRLSIIEVNLTERHLSSDWEAYAVDGPDVEGYLRGYELNYDRFFYKGWYISANVGYYNDYYRHTKLDMELENKTLTVGSGIGFITSNLFGVDHLYLNFSNPVRFYFNSIDETKMGETTIRPHVIVNNMWLLIGYKF